jgi:hypothetical protein
MSGRKSESRYNISMTHHQKLVGDCRQKSRVIFKMLALAFWRQKLPNESTLKLYILRSSCPEEKPQSQYELIVY